MATILGVAASIIAVIQLTERAATLSYRYTNGVKEAPSHFKSLLDELNSLSQVLSTLQDSAKARPGSNELGRLCDHGGPLGGCILELEKLQKKLQPGGSWGKLMGRLLWPLKEKETFDIILRIERYKNLFMLALNADQLSVRIEEKRMTALNWIYPEAFDTRHLEISGRRQPNTGQWILEEPEMQAWGLNSRLIWGYGIPGAGKTFLTSVVIDHFLDQAPEENYGVAYIYFHYKEQARQGPLCVLASLVKQLASQIQYLPREIEDLYDNLARQHKRPSLEELYTMLGVVSKAFVRTFIICDALDEYEENARRSKLLPLVHRMLRDGLSLFLTSREYPQDIQDSLRSSTKIRLWARDADIASYVGQKIEESTRVGRLNLPGGSKSMIISQLTNCAKGMFLIAYFHVEHLCRQPTAGQMLEELEKIKSSTTEERPLDPIYDRALGRLQEQPQNCVKLALEIFSWLVKARRTLTVRELQMAVTVKQGQKYLDERDLPTREILLDVCVSLVTIDEKSDMVMLVHETVQEYLLKYSIIPKDANFKLAMACTAFLSLDICSGACTSPIALNARYFWYPFLLYAAQNLSYHLQSCHEDCTMELLLGFLARPSSTLTYLQTLHAPRHVANESSCFDWYPKRQTPLHIAASLGHCPAVRLLSERIDIHAQDDRGRTALHLAASGGHHLVVRHLLERGVNISIRDTKGQTALHKAAYQRHLSATKVLLDNGADPCIVDKEGRIPLHQAAQEGNELMVQLLLRRSSGKSIATALCLDATQRHESIVRLLVARCGDISNTGGSSFPSPGVLHMAVIQGHELVVRLLLEKGANPSATDCHQRSVLGLAVFQGNEEMVKLLLDRGAIPSSELHLAATKGNESIVRMLLEKKADPSALDMDGLTPLYRALNQGYYPNIYRKLNQESYSVYGVLGQGVGSRLVMAGGHESIIRLLLEYGADPSVVDKYGWTVLIHAAYHGIEPIVRLLLRRGADISFADGEGQTALHQAATGGHESVVRLLLWKGANISARDGKGQTALHRAANGGYEPVVKVLLDQGADTSVADWKSQTALHWAAYGGRQLVVKLLISEGVKISAMDGKGQTALHWAAKGGHYSVVELLFNNGADLSVRDRKGQTALHLASIKGHEPTVKLLLEKGADLSVVDNDGWNPRLRASSQGYYTIARLLLEKELASDRRLAEG